MNAQLDSFETALLTRLREHVDKQPDVRPRFSRPRLLLGAAATVAAAAVMVVVIPGLGTTTAYSVQEGNSGTITVEVNRLENAEGLEAELAKFGVRADITYLPGKQECAPGRYTPVDRRLSGMQVSMGANVLRVTIPPGAVRDDETFVMAVSGEAIPPSTEPSQDGITDMGGFSGWTDFNVTGGPVQPCTAAPNAAG
jgi:hypothetical protein